MIDDELHAQAQRICHRVICGRPSASEIPELQRDADLAEEVRSRLEACGLQLQLAKGHNRWVATGLPDLRDDVEQPLSEPQLAALAYLYLQLDVAPAPGEHTKPRVLVHEFCQEFGRSRGWTVSYVRRAVLGPLATAEYVRITEPGGSRREAFLTSGPRMTLLDRRRLIRALEPHVPTTSAA